MTAPVLAARPRNHDSLFFAGLDLDAAPATDTQRARMLEATARAVASKGYVNTTVADIVALAGVSRTTFYAQFADKEDCFTAALDTVTDLFLGHLAHVLEQAEGEPLERLSAVLAAYLEQLAAEPELAHTFLIEVYAAGRQTVRRRVEVMQRFQQLVAEVLEADDEETRFACEALVAAVSSLATMRVAAGESERLPELHGRLVALAARLLQRA